ncbi:ferritin-like domain-containing protein [Hydrogenothermus marinus]|uniref:Bacterioferritin n=1 Tax=Hydrogenothermus marinus TaxID=133270 RepID=A0A3M0BFF0_9AQUI|nr:ferritin-like domain-containing protein [Hydrogenothermus marinus]RMA96040.1 bacterioferritin [Hydrogenothermus marinus]
MAQKGISIIRGLDVDELIKLLNKAYADEWLAYYQYYIEAKVIKGIMKDAVIAELNQHAADELRHAGLLADRIIQLGGTPLLNPKDWLEQTNCGYITPTDFDVLKILEDAIEGERCAIDIYSKIADITNGKDIVTYDIVKQILEDEVEHEEDLVALQEDITSFIKQLKGE